MSTEGYFTLFLVLCFAIWATTRTHDDGMRSLGYVLLAVVAFFLLMGVVSNG